jgi:hypothetical protein
MNKKEIAEIKKQFDPDRCAISRICGCYVDHEKQIKTQFKQAFLALPQEEMFKYFTILKGTLSGTLGKNLLNMEFPLEAEKEDGPQAFLLALRDSKLQDDAIIEEFYKKVIDYYNYGENYYIVLIHAAYDVPGKAKDNLLMEDASDTVYEHVLCSICPVKLAKSALCYNEEHNSIEERVRDWVVDAPAHGFLFPAFNDRASDVHGLLYFSKNPETLQQEFIDEMFGCMQPLTSKSQKSAFSSIIEETLGDGCDFEAVKTIHENLHDIIEENKESPVPVTFEKNDVKRLLEVSGVSDEALEEFDTHFEAEADEKAVFAAANVVNSRSFEVKTPDVVVKVNPGRTDLVETREIDGKRYLLIEINENVEVNGIVIRSK